MKIICAGLPKTGTTSMAAALRVLGFTVHDHLELIQYHMDEYIQGLQGITPDFQAMYSDVDATTDSPACFFWKEMKGSFPDAKVILMERDSVDSWLQSILHTQNACVENRLQDWTRLGFLMTPTGRKWKKHTELVDIRLAFFKKDKLPDVYTKHNARVISGVPQDDLLVFNVKQGWKPLCEFLGVEVPDVPFPRLNVKSGAIPDIINQSAVGKRVFNELVLVVTILFIFVAIVIFMIVN